MVWPLAGVLAVWPALPVVAADAACKGTVYLTLDTGNMKPAEEIVAILNKHHVKATFFLANEKTWRGDYTLDAAWAGFWQARVAEGHAFGSHTWRHHYFRADIGNDQVDYAPSGKKTGERLNVSQVCDELKKSEQAFMALTGRKFDPIWRAPGGKVTPNTLRFAQSCGFRHVPWSPAGFSGDELPSEKFPGDALMASQKKGIQDGDILLWHLGIWSRREPLYPRLDELIAALKARGLCFARMTEHPGYQ